MPLLSAKKFLIFLVIVLQCATSQVWSQDFNDPVGSAMKFDEVHACSFNDLSESGINSIQSKESVLGCVQLPADLKVPRIILAHGKIERNSSDILAQVSEFWPPGSLVVFQSSGGDLLGGLRLGQVLRAKGFSSYVSKSISGLPKMHAGKCYSACAYAFLGGNIRYVDGKSQYGVHQFRMVGPELDQVKIQKIVVILAKYLDLMGVSRELLDRALMTDPKLMLIVGPVDRLRWKIETSKP